MLWIKIGSLLMFLAVGLGAFGAHALRSKLTPEALDIYKTAVFYHFVHTLALFLVAWMSTLSSDPKILAAGTFLTMGIFIFSGSLYLLAVTGQKWLGAVTPLGGLAFLMGWFLIFFSQFSK